MIDMSSSWQVEQTEMMLHLTRCLMEPNDTVSLAMADNLRLQLQNISVINNDLLVGNGIPGVLTLSAQEVRVTSTLLAWYSRACAPGIATLLTL